MATFVVASAAGPLRPTNHEKTSGTRGCVGNIPRVLISLVSKSGEPAASQSRSKAGHLRPAR